jgi:catechol 2,3-dioxygenase-like lactoylglutathione lyase family enzyme
MPATLEHANVTVTDAEKTAAWMCSLFDWHIRWQGPAPSGGKSLHVGTDTQYLALYQPADALSEQPAKYCTKGSLNHIAVVVENLDATEKSVNAAGFFPQSHADYPPGKRFYFHDHDDIEYEIVSYS